MVRQHARAFHAGGGDKKNVGMIYFFLVWWVLF